MRLTGDEMEQVGHTLAAKLNAAGGPTCVIVPHGGLSIANVPGGELYDPAADARLFAALDADLSPRVHRVDVADHANSVACAGVAARLFLQLSAVGHRPPAGDGATATAVRLPEHTRG